MGLLGRAIAAHLSSLKGLYSVELPLSLEPEMSDLVASCNAKQPTRALLVGDRQTVPSGVMQVAWPDVLGWRTADDRIFVWRRNERDPDTSFRDVVRPFLAARFPGTDGGECSTDLLSSLCVDELWRSLALPLGGPAFEAFKNTAVWLGDLLVAAFEHAGSMATEHWTDRFLEHWALTWSDLEQGMQSLNSAPEERHAWELLRLAGIPVPARETDADNPFLTSPARRLERFQDNSARLARWWQELVDDFVIPRGGIETLLMALDHQVPGAQKPTPWRGLNWAGPTAMSPGTPAPTVGRQVFARAPSPTLLSSTPPAFPIAPVPAWWGVNTHQLESACEALRQVRGIVTNPSCAGLSTLPGRETALFLKTRSGTVSEKKSAKKRRITISITGLSLRVKEPWTTLYVAHSLPPQGAHGATAVDPDSVELSVSGSGVKVDLRAISVAPDGQLEVQFDIVVTYSATVDAGGTDSGSWHPVRTMRVLASARDGSGTGWGEPRALDHSVEIVVPSSFSPTLLAYSGSRGKLVVAPDRSDIFTRAEGDKTWSASATPDLLLPEEGPYTLVGYDGRIGDGPIFAGEAGIDVEGRSLSPSTGLQQSEVRLDEGEQITGSTAGLIAVVKLKQRSQSVTSGLVAAIRKSGSGRKPPSSSARASVLGRFQGAVVNSVRDPSENPPDNLFQYVLGTAHTTVEWPPFARGSVPTVVANLPLGFQLPGVGNGPSQAVTSSAPWRAFLAASRTILNHLGLRQGEAEVWLSAINPGELPGPAVQEFLEAHRALVAHARSVCVSDLFWTSYPFSIVVVNDASGASLGQVQAVFLSPLHPVRLAWAFSVARLAQSASVDRALLGLAEGWNLPLTGTTVSVTGQPIPMVALPLDPGEDTDFAAWSALGILGSDGLVRVPRLAAGLELPWGGPSGINEKVVNQAIIDYLAVHPYLNSLEVDVRSVSAVPRAREIDAALVRAVGSAAVREVALLGGATRIWDSDNRLGDPPSRDRLLTLRDAEWRDRPFEWRRYPASTNAPTSDIALIENASVHMGAVQATTTGVLGPLPLRRYTVPAISGRVLDQQYAAVPGDDVLGLSQLLAEIEHALPNGAAALRVAPQANALGIGSNARWEVLGTLNIDPALLSNTIRAGGHADRMLWEWRPSWLTSGHGDRDELAKRAHYVVARVPASLIKALASRQGLAESQAHEMVTELGRRGIGLASLQAAGGTQESAAAGHFYATRLLFPPPGHSQPQHWVAVSSSTFVGLLPIDPVVPILSAIAGKPLRRRADLLAFKVAIEGDAVRIGIIPIEVKHHGQPQQPSQLPAENDPELKRAREQLKDAAKLVQALSAALDPGSELARDPAVTVARRQACAALLDLALSFADEQVDPSARAMILRRVVQGRVVVDAGAAMLLWFAPGLITTSGAACIVRPDAEENCEAFIDPTAVPGTWWPGNPLGPDDALLRTSIDDAISAMLAVRKELPADVDTDLSAALLAMLGLTPGTSGGPGPTGGAGSEPGGTESAPPAHDPDRPIEVPEPSTGGPVAPTETARGLASSNSSDAELPTIAEVAPPATTPVSLAPPAAYVGWSEPSTRYCLLGNLIGSDEQVGLDLDNPKAIGVFGYMGSGKSYLLGTLVESALVPIPGINSLPAPLAVVIFNYRRHSADRFELSSFAHPNSDRSDCERLKQLYQASPRGIDDIHILCLPGQLTPKRVAEYGELPASELFFDPTSLGVEDWELLMGEPGSNAVFARAIRNTLMDLQAAGDVSLESLERSITNTLNRSSQSAAQLRLDFVRRYLSAERGLRFSEILRPGRAVIFDLRQPLFNKDDALRFFLVCANHISQVQGGFNKLVVFDEAHEYMSEAFGEKIEARIRLMRHEGTSYVFATQDVSSIPLQIRRFITTKFIFSLGTRDNVTDLVRFAPEFSDLPLQQLAPGTCYVQAIPSQRNLFARPRLVQVRPRITQHGGTSRIFTGAAETD